MAAAMPVIDGHMDMLYAVAREGRDFFVESASGQTDLPRLRRGGVSAALCAIYYSADGQEDDGLRATLQLADALRNWVERSRGTMRLVRSVADLDDCLQPGGPFGAIMHLEGADGIDADLAALRLLQAVGLRSLGLVWSRPNRFGQGVGPSDQGQGLTDAGHDLVRECQRLGILVDVSHLNDAGFWEVAKLARAPFVATHSNARALCANPRNLTDDMLRAVAASGGLVGLNFHVGFVRRDQQVDAATPIAWLIDHLEHMVTVVGIDHVALGSDYDGCRPPRALSDVTKLPALLAALRRRGWHEADLTKLWWQNYRRLLGDLWRAAPSR